MHWRFAQGALRRYLRRSYDAKLLAQLHESHPTLSALAAAHDIAKRHALATAEGSFRTGPGGAVRTTRRTDRAVLALLGRAARAYRVDVEELRAVRDHDRAVAAEAFLRAPTTHENRDRNDQRSRRTA